MFARNILLNLLGQVAPLVAAAFSIPLLIASIGLERFGLLTIAWMVIGYFSVFDLGIGRAMTKVVASRIGDGKERTVAPLVWTGLALMSSLGALGCLALALASSWLTLDVLKVKAALVYEARNTFLILAFSVPAVILTTGLRGVMEAYGRFDLSNLIRVPMGVWTFVGPLVLLPFTHRLDCLVSMLLLGRILTTIWHAVLLHRSVPGVFATRRLSAEDAGTMLRFGGWMTVSNVISPVMVYMDRFLIGSILGLAVVAFYTTPYEVVFKLNFFPEAVFGVLFPMMAAKLSKGHHDASRLYAMGNKLMAAVMFPLTFFLVLSADDILRLWLNDEFSSKSTIVMQVLAIGLCINSFSKVTFNLLQAAGRADVTAGIHILELPIYLVALWFLSTRFGVAGAAYAWAGRMMVDLALTSWAATRVAGLEPHALKKTVAILLSAAVLFFGAMEMVGMTAKALYLIAGLVSYLLGLWFFAFDAVDRKAAAELLRKTPMKRFFAKPAVP